MSDIMSGNPFPSALQRADIKRPAGGMVSTKPTTLIPEGSFLTVQDLLPTPFGLQRRNGWRNLLSMKANHGKVPIATGETVTDLESYFDKDNKLQLLCFTDKRMYVNKVGEKFIPVPFGQLSYDITTVSATRVTCSAAAFVVDRVRIGDVARFTTGTTVSEATITGVAALYIDMVAVPVEVTAASVLEIIREFDPGEDGIIDYTFIPKAVVVVDGSARGVWRYDGEKLVDMKVHGASIDTPDEDYLEGAKTVFFFNGYLMLGNTIESYTDVTLNNKLDQKRTLRWSSVTDISEFSIVDYIIFTREMSEVVKITATEESPIVFLSNAIYYGQVSTLSGLPYQYARMESGAVSAVGRRAMTSVPGGMVFIAQKNIYMLTLSTTDSRTPTLIPLGDAIFNRSCMENNSFADTRAVFSPQDNALICCFPKAKRRLGRMFYFSFDTKTWSYVEDAYSRFVTINTFPYYMLVKWLDGDTETWADFDPYTWYSLKLEDYTTRVFVLDSAGYMYVSDAAYNYDDTITGGGDVISAPFTCVVESGDLDFGSPGVYKMLSKLFITLGEVPLVERTAAVSIKVEISTDRGKSWTQKGTITIEDDTFIEDCDVRSTGEVIRFRLTFGINSPLFTFAEYELRYRIMGSFSQRGA
jgi:hypothetical protein